MHHYGDPCVHCGIPHDDVPVGPCAGGSTERQLCDRAIAALTEIENRMRKKQPALRLEVIEHVMAFARQFSDEPEAKG